MKVVITQYGSALTEGGITAFIFELSNALIQDGHDVFVLSGRDLPKTQATIRNMFGVERLPRILTLQESQEAIWFSKISRDAMKELFLWASQGSSLVKKIAPDMIIINGAAPVFSSAFKVAVCHDLEFRGQPWSSALLTLYDKVLYQMFDNVATTSTELSQAAPSKLGIKPEKVVTIPICIDTHKYIGLPQEQREHAILHVGTWPDKNLETTVKAFCKLAKTDSAIRLYVVGVLNEKNKDVLSKVKEEFSKRIYCVGKVSKIELRELYSRVKVTSVPSTYQIPVLSPTVLESLASGTPVVGGSTAISRDLLVDGYDGFRVYPTDFSTLSERVSLLTRNNELWNRLSINARSIAMHFDASVVSKKYVKLCNLRKLKSR
jgi:glycosyltransferase involved in cell wall biosynthesis